VLSLVLFNSRVGLVLENAVNPELGQRVFSAITGGSIRKCLLNFFNCFPPTTYSKQILVVVTGLKRQITSKARRLKVVTITDCALNSPGLDEIPASWSYTMKITSCRGRLGEDLCRYGVRLSLKRIICCAYFQPTLQRSFVAPLLYSMR